MAKIENKASRQRIAVIGGGAAGMAAAFLLSQRHDVVLYEASPDLGGHAHAVTLVDRSGQELLVDTAFLIFNDRTYREFGRFLARLGVQDHGVGAEMSSCFADPQRRLDYALGLGLAPFFQRPATLFRPDLLRILRDLRRFRTRAALDLDAPAKLVGVSVRDYLAPYSRAFVEAFVLPLTAAIWSLPDSEILDCPILLLLRYFDNHSLLQGDSGRRWRTFEGSSAVYVRAFARSFAGQIRLRTPVTKVLRTANGVDVIAEGATVAFDHVVMAVHADVALRLIDQPTVDENRLLGVWTYRDNPVTLHSDSSLLHADPRLWCSWNMLRTAPGTYRISYYLNRLQSLPTSQPMILTLGTFAIKDDLVWGRFNYRHPVFDARTMAAQAELGMLNGGAGLSFCGSYFGYGFHEDAVASAVGVARRFGIGWE